MYTHTDIFTRNLQNCLKKNIGSNITKKKLARLLGLKFGNVDYNFYTEKLYNGPWHRQGSGEVISGNKISKATEGVSLKDQ